MTKAELQMVREALKESENMDGYRDWSVHENALAILDAELAKPGALSEAEKDTERLSYIIEESYNKNTWLGDDVWDRVAALPQASWDNCNNDIQKWVRAAIDQARGKK